VVTLAGLQGDDIAMVSMGSHQKSSPPLGASDKPPFHGEASKFTSNSQRKYSFVDGEGKSEGKFTLTDCCLVCVEVVLSLFLCKSSTPVV